MTGKFDNRINELYTDLVEKQQLDPSVQRTVDDTITHAKDRGKLAAGVSKVRAAAGNKKEITRNNIVKADDEYNDAIEKIIIPSIKKKTRDIVKYGNSLES